MSQLPFTLIDIEANFNEPDLARGRQYWRRGAVQQLEIRNHGFLLTGKVRGTASWSYDVTVTIASEYRHITGEPSLREIESDCSCPVGMMCKHGVALCLQALMDDEGEIDAAESPVYVSDEPVRKQRAAPVEPWETWWSDLAYSGALIAATHGKPKECIAYILEIREDRSRTNAKCLRIRAVIARLMKTGEYKSTRDISPAQIARSQARYVTPNDALIARLLQDDSQYHYSGFSSPPASAEILDLVMRCVLESERCFFQTCEGTPLALGKPRRGKLGWRTADISEAQIPTILSEDESPHLVILPSARPWYVDTATQQAGRFDFDAPLVLVRKFLAGPRIHSSAVTKIAEKIAAAQSVAGIILPPRTRIVETRPLAPPTPCLRLATYDTNRGHDIAALVHFDYDGLVADPTTPETLHKEMDNRTIHIPRDRRSENHYLATLLQHSGLVTNGLVSRPQDVPANRLACTFPNRVNARVQWLDFIHRVVPELHAMGWRVAIDADLADAFRTVATEEEDFWEAEVREQEGKAAWWFSLDLGIMVEGQRVSLLPLLVQALQRLQEPTTAAIERLAFYGKLYVDLPDGRALALPFERVRDILTTLVELHDQPLNPDGTMTLALDLAAALSRIDAATKMRWLGGERLRMLVDRLKTFSGLTDVAPPRGLAATLRPYQRAGLNWLQFLRDYQLGGILADDMGLGKTVQTLAHLLTEQEAGRLNDPSLVICPTSLIPNWQDEAQKFTPSLRVLSLHGKERATRFGQIGNADLVLTTYPLLTRDAEILLATEWYMVVLDEAQAIKNPAAKVTQLACEIKAKHRLCLTGTPIENHLGEAWSQFAFLMPGMLGTHKDFAKRFRTPIEKMQDTGRQLVLARRLKPFILRRNKNEVAKELPPKTEIIHYVEFNGQQRDLYETLRLIMHEKVQQAVLEKGFNRSRIIILDALLKLRQVCCDPRLVRLRLSRVKKVTHSAKLESLMELLPEMIEEGRKILLFSQFTSMLDLIKPRLEMAGIAFVEICGDTEDRRTPVARFQNGDVPLFLISLKAGGTGLNLTAADVVIHYDPWWNPAVENQATDRAHRIGQDKPVFVYKFIARGTVEERILELQNRKRALASALLEERPDATAAFEANDLDFLFREAG